jgi:uncharacterized protein (DUF779 family)
MLSIFYTNLVKLRKFDQDSSIATLYIGRRDYEVWVHLIDVGGNRDGGGEWDGREVVHRAATREAGWVV